MSNILTPNQVAGYAQAAGFRGSACTTAVAIAGAETGGTWNAEDIGDINLTEQGEKSVGLWQINYRPSRDRGDPVRDPNANLNPATNAAHAYTISSGGSNFNPWSTFKSGAYKKYLSTAAQATGSPVTVASGSSSGSSGGSLPNIGSAPPSDTAAPLFDLGDLTIGGIRAVTDVGYSLVEALIELTAQEASQLTLKFYDPDCLILDRFKLAAGPPDPTVIEAWGLRWRLFSLASEGADDGPKTVFVCQPSGVMLLRSFTPRPVKNTSPSLFVEQTASDVGLHAETEASAVQGDITAQEVQDQVTGAKRYETAWELFQRLAGEHGFVCYETAGTVRFGTAQGLAKLGSKWQLMYRGFATPEQMVWAAAHGVGRPLAGEGFPTITATSIGSSYAINGKNPKARQFTGKIGQYAGGIFLRAGDQVTPWGVHLLDGLPALTVTSVSWDPLGVTPVTVQAVDASMFNSKYVNVADDTAATAPDPQTTGAGRSGAGWRTAKCLDEFIDQLNAYAPHRSKSTDGTIGDAAHQTHQSDHNPDSNGVVRAFDATQDPAHGADMAVISERLRHGRDDRISYVIFNRRIFRSYTHGSVQPWTWDAYTGDSPHTDHMHLSVIADPARYDDTSPWGCFTSATTPVVLHPGRPFE